jgi:AbrB family looped-hinge helix DNA binding protein
MEISILTSKGQLLIPKRLRTKYGIETGVKVIFEETKEGLIIKPMDEKYFESFAGILKGTGNLKGEMKKMKEEELKLEEKRLHFKPGKK